MNATPATPADGGRTRILVVEDEAIIARDLADRLAARGYEVTGVAGTGAAAVRLAAQDPPDLVLMDIVLPGEIDGIEAARLIRAGQDVPVVYVTAYAGEAVVARAAGTGASGYLVKPYEIAELVRTIEVAVTRHRLERRVRESEEWLATTLASIGEAVVAADTAGRVTYLNPAAEGLLGLERAAAAGRPLEEVLDLRDPRTGARADPAACGGAPAALRRADLALASPRGGSTAVTCTAAPIVAPGGRRIGTVLALRDVTAEKEAERELLHSREELRRHVEEVRERNTALKVLLEQRESDRRELEDRIMGNVRSLVLPYLERLEAIARAPREAALLQALRESLEQVVSPFCRRLSSGLHALTPQELRVASLVREGRSDKEITDLMNISAETVKTHRQNIRKKLGIYGTGASLRAQLVQLSD